MTIKLKQRILLQAIDIHRHLTNEIKIQFLENSIRIKSVDPAHYEMVITDIPKRTCEEYSLGDGDLEIGMDLKKLRDFLRLFKKDDVLTFDYDPDTNRLIGKQGYLTRGMGLLDMTGWNSEKTPKVELKNMVSVDTKIFYASLKGIISNKNYEQTSIIVIRDGVMLEKIDEDEDKDKRDRAVIMQDTGALTVNHCNANDKNNYIIFRSDILIKQINEYKKCFDHVTIETSPEEPIRITANNDNLQVEYWLAPIIPDESYGRQKMVEEQKEEIKPKLEIKEPLEAIKEIVKPTEFDRVEPVDGTVGGIEYAADEVNDPAVYGDAELEDSQEEYIDAYKDKPEPKSKEGVKPMVIPIRKPKHQPYKKQQWSQDMEYIRDTIEKHRLNRDTKQDKIKQVAEYKGFVFFINRPQIETELSYVKIKNKNGNQIIQQVLPDGYVLIAWFKWHENGWIAQTVKNAG